MRTFLSQSVLSFKNSPNPKTREFGAGATPFALALSRVSSVLRRLEPVISRNSGADIKIPARLIVVSKVRRLEFHANQPELNRAWAANEVQHQRDQRHDKQNVD